MSRLAHVGYRIEGTTELPVAEILKRSMFAPTVVGGPLENATRVIARYETCGRSYYSGVAAIVEEDERGPLLDSAILIRTAEIENDGTLAIGVGRLWSASRIPSPRRRDRGESGLRSRVPSAATRSATCPRRTRSRSRSAGGAGACRGSGSGREARAHRPLSRRGGAPAIVILDNEDAFTSMLLVSAA